MKGRKFWEYIKDFGGVTMVETWITEKECVKWEGKLPTGFNWSCLPV